MQFTSGTRLATRRIIATAVAERNNFDPFAYAAKRWPGDSPIVTRTAIGGSTSTDWSAASQPALLFDAVASESVVGRARLRAVPANVRLLQPNSRARGYWVAESKAIPLSKLSVTGSALAPRKVAGIIVTTAESLETQDSRVERALEADIRRALTLALDDAFLAPDNAGVTGQTPAAVTYGIPVVAGTSDPTNDLGNLFEDFAGDLSQAVFVTDPTTAGRIALWRDSGGAAPFLDCGPSGGSLLGLPLLTSYASPRDSSGGSIALIDGSGIALALEGMELTQSNEAMLEMSDAPLGASDTPTAASVTKVNMFQTETVAFKFVLRVSWERQRTGCVAVISGASY